MSKEMRVFGVVVLSLIMSTLLVGFAFKTLAEATPPLLSYGLAIFLFFVAAAVPMFLIHYELQQGSWSPDPMPKGGLLDRRFNRWFIG